MLKRPKKNGYYRIINQKTGRVKLVKHYQNGSVHGKLIYYWDNGQIRVTGQYDNMQRIGVWKTYDFKGTLILEENYDTEEEHLFEKLALFPIQSVIRNNTT